MKHPGCNDTWKNRIGRRQRSKPISSDTSPPQAELEQVRQERGEAIAAQGIGEE